MADLLFQAADGAPGGFVADVDGYLCFVLAVDGSGGIMWKWQIQSGGGWTHRGGASVKTHAEGHVFTTLQAQEKIIEALQDLGLDI